MNAYAVPGCIYQHISTVHPVEVCDLLLKEHYKITLDEICIKTRNRDILRMRQIVQTVLARWSKIPLAEIGILTGNRNHATILNSKRRIENDEYIFKKYNSKSDFLAEYITFENRYQIYMQSNHVKIERGYRSFKDEKRCT